MLKKKLYGCFFVLALLVHACGQSDETPTATSGNPIQCSIISADAMKGGRALIGSGDDLLDVCTDAETIALWGNYVSGDIAGEIFKATPLAFVDGAWNYTGGDRHWLYNSFYKFRACYPQNLLGDKLSSTEDGVVTVAYNTETLQEDLLVSYKEIDSGSWDLKTPVPLTMKHALATIKFIFQMDGGNTVNELKSFSLDRTLRTSADLNYSTESVSVDNWINKTASPANRIYEWSDNEGLPFSSSQTASPYSGDGIYCNNGGFVLIIPQSCNVAPTFTCTIGAHTYNDISLGTKLFEPGKNYIYTIKMKDNTLSVSLRIKAWNELDSSYNIIF